MEPSKKAADAGAVGPEDYAKDGACGRANKNSASGFKLIATKSGYFPEHYIAKISMDKVWGIHLWS